MANGLIYLHQHVQSESRLGHEDGIARPLINPAVRMARRDNEANARPEGAHSLRESCTVHLTGEPDVREQHRSGITVLLEQRDSGLSALASDHVEHRLFQQSDGEVAHARVILNHEHKLGRLGSRTLAQVAFLQPKRIPLQKELSEFTQAIRKFLAW